MKSIHSDQISDFVEIYSDKVELVSIDRQNYDDFQALCHQFIKSKKELNLRWIQNINDEETFEEILPETLNPKLRSMIQKEIIDSSRLLSELMGCNKIEVRLAKLESPMCPIFHIDRIRCRLLITLCGECTEWISNSDVDWEIFSNREKNKIPIKSGKFINRLEVGRWSILKGSEWDKDFNGVVHRSPNEIGERLLLSLDPILDS